MGTLVITQEQLDRVKDAAETAYREIGSVKCPYLNAEVAFNAKGLDHIKLMRWGHARSLHDQFMRLKLLHFAPTVVVSSRTLQGLRKHNRMERIKIRSKWETRMVQVTYYEFISVQEIASTGDLCRVRIVLKQVDGGPVYFWSIVPYWKQNDAGGKDIYEGNPEED